MIPTSARPVYRIVASAAAALPAAAVAGCSGAPPTDGTRTTAISSAGGPDQQTAALTVAADGRGAGLAAVARIGRGHGGDPAAIAMGGRLGAAGQSHVTAVEQAGGAAGVTVDASAPAGFPHSRPPVWSCISPDVAAAWLTAANDRAAEARAAANALLGAPDSTSDATRATFRSWLTDIDAALGAADAAARPAGATVPSSVAAGDGGRLAAASAPRPLAGGLALIGVGGLLIGAALHRRRTSG